jgi:hypothetical protein
MAVDFVVIGVQKAGTSSLYRYLHAHSHVAMATKSELEFFSNDRNFSLGLDHYSSFFPEGDDGMLRGEVSPAFLRSPDAAVRLLEVAPRAKLVAVLRDPTERAFSAWKMQITKGSETCDFASAVARTDHYLDFGRYGSQLTRVIEVFPREQLLVMFFDDLVERASDFFGELCSFLGIPVEDHGPIRENPGGMPRNRSVVSLLNLAFRARDRLRAIGLGLVVDNRRIDRGARVLRNRIAAWNRGGEPDRTVVEAETARKIVEALSEEIDIVEHIAGRDLSAWKDK